MNSKKNGLKVLLAFFLIILALGSGTAIAANPNRQAARQACKDDCRTFCKGAQPGGGRLIDCLKQNFDKLSPGCQQALKAAKASRQSSSQRQ